ncbi:MAG: helix-turn-helix domain-containing protein [Candidatus Thiodiazotropha sp. (ex Lucinoma borealis)]|nr:helix-turn-helix domain-containing protein [Candidatus Thiodiazotropha sp. (ex Lucinoma borealis)]
MNEDGLGIRPETLALDALIQATIEHAEDGAGHPSSDSMLFLGNRHASFPTLVVQDPILEPVDKLVWMAIRLQASEAGGNTAFPSYAYIAKMANVSSTATISRAIAILRATRWLTLCARVRGASGRFHGNVFALHDEPLPLVDAIHLDSSYMQFLRESADHRHARVQAVARGVLDTIDEDIKAGRNVCTDEHPIVRRVQATEAVEKDMPHRFFSFSAKVMTELRSNSPSRNGANHQGQNLKPASCSSSYINKTTTTNNSERKNFVVCGKGDAPLIYPRRLSDNQRELADRYLSVVSADQRQAVLDELEGRIRSEQRGMKPLYDELSFLHSLCKALKNGEFKSNLGIKVLEDRIAREKALQKSREERIDRSADKGLQELRSQIKAGKGPIAEIRKTLGMRCPSTKDTDSNTS